MCTALSYPRRPLHAVKIPISAAPPGDDHPPSLLKVSKTSLALPIGEVTQSTTTKATQLAMCTTIITPSSAGNSLDSFPLKMPPIMRATMANSVGNHWLLAADELGW